MAPAWCMQCDSWRGRQYSYGENCLWTAQIVRLATLLEKPGNFAKILLTQKKHDAAICTKCIVNAVSSPASSKRDRGEREDLLYWKTSFQEHRRWGGDWHQTSTGCFSGFRPKESWDALLPDNLCRPGWVDAQLATLNTGTDRSAPAASPCSLLSDHADQLSSPGFEKRLTPEAVKKLCQQGQVKGAIEVLEVLVRMKSAIDNNVFYSVLKECVAKKDLILGGQVQALAVKQGFGSDTFLCNHFIRMYAGHGKLREAMDVFRGVALPDTFMWFSVISAHVKQGQAERAIELYRHMRASVTKPNRYVLAAALQACAAAGDLLSGRQVYDDVLTSGMEHNMFVCSCLVDMFAKCGSLKDARRVFDRLDKKNVIAWTAMIAGYAKVEGMGQEALDLYSAMHNEGVATPNSVTFVCLLQACANVGVSAIEKGKQLHSQLLNQRLESDVAVGGSLVNMYAKCGNIKDARIVFDGLGEKNVVAWNAMIAGYAQQEGMGQEALDIYSAMHKEGIAVPNRVTFICVLQACANIGVSALEQGKQLHSQLKDRRLESDVVVGGSLVNMYVKCGNLKDARIVFDGLGEKNVAAWNAMIAGYAQQEGMGQEALNIYSDMLHNEGLGATPDAVTYVHLLQACASVGALQQGKQVHSQIREGGLECNLLVGTRLVRMYATCGCLEASREVFDRLPMKDLATWTALMKGYAEHGEGGQAIQCFDMLMEHGIQPDEVTYSCLFAACSHAGLVGQAQQYFETMVERHGVEPNHWHYNCMVDLLGRSGHLDRAEQMLRASGLAGSSVSWTALLSACKSYGDADLGNRCFDHLVSLQPTAATAYVLLASIYANAGRWDEVDRVESLRRAAGARKMPAKACIEVMEEVHEFTVGEERSDVAAASRKVNATVREEGGHVPLTQLVLRANVSEQEKEAALCGHAEKLALAYGLLNTPAGSPLLVTKNLRMCNDCHSSTKILSRLEKRAIVVRDGHKVHRFRNGVCSCQDRP